MSEWVSLEAGAMLADRYEIVGTLGRGGFGATYRAVDHGRLDEPCVVKELLPPVGRGSPERGGPALAVACERFEREARTLLKLRSPHVPRLHAYFEEGGRFFLVQDLVEGRTLHQLLAEHGPLDEAAVRAVVAQGLEVLAYLHGQRPPVLHRDIKPANVILDGTGRVHLIDFGAVREALTDDDDDESSGPTTRVGTPGYAPFEQVMGRAVPASDLYALGATAVTLLTGEEPLAWLGRHGDSWVLDGATGASAAFERFLGRLLADLPSRFATAAEARRALDELEAPRRRTSGPRRPSGTRWSLGRRRVASTVAAAAVVAAGAAAGLAWRRAGAAGSALDRNRVTVFPLVVSGEVSGARTVGEDVATAIGAALDGVGPVRWVDGWRLLDPRARDDVRALARADARRLARAERSGLYLTGRLARRGDSVDVYLTLADVATDTVVATARTTGPAGDPWRAGRRAVSHLLPNIVPGDTTGLTVGWDALAPAAVGHFLLAESAFRRAHMHEALDHYRAAVAADTAFALAAVRGAEAATWTHRDDEAAALTAVALRRPLPPRDAHFARGTAAYVAGRADSAAAELRRALRVDPDMAVAWVELSEVYLHLLPRAGDADSLARDAVERAARLDPRAAGHVHLAELRVRDGDPSRFRPVVEEILAASPDSAIAAQLRLGADCVRGATVDWDAAVARDPLSVLAAAKTLAGGGAQLPCARAAYAAVIRADTLGGGDSETRRWTAVAGLQSAAIAAGDPAEAEATIDRALAAGLGGNTLLLLDAAVEPRLVGRADAVARADAERFGATYERCPSVRRLWHLGVWAATRGRADLATAIARHADSLVARGGTRADSLDARAVGALAALARGDTAAAIRGLEPLLAEPAPADDLTWDLGAPRGVERLTLARLLLARGEAQRALDVANVLGATWPSVYTLFLPASLALRADAAAALGEPAASARLRARLAGLRRGGAGR